MSFWNEGSFENLLLRAEAQHGARLEARRNRRAGDAGRAKAVRAKKLAAEGAYRKAVQGLMSETAQLTTEEQKTWARKLLPNTCRTSGAREAPEPDGSAAKTFSD